MKNITEMLEEYDRLTELDDRNDITVGDLLTLRDVVIENSDKVFNEIVFNCIIAGYKLGFMRGKEH